ncbi:hypothetical protein BD410DRAFT_898851 [Rickenella mellea]|uniref:DUF6533 domain-containing protein n=1 Tax=Rickenella mellea TaxID=50990 RepID=A0A4Y7Q2R7_9AGAM|nr:hypothetical protein BD410DRAFT_898851 [Rickenella mellea]
MSDSSPDIAGLIAQATQLQFNNCIVISATALVFYDYALTFSTEKSEIWNSKFTGAQALFFLTRYSFMIYTVSFAANELIRNPPDAVCRALFFNATAWVYLPQIGLYCILTLRTYAIYQKNLSVLAILGLTCAAAVAVGLYRGFVAKSEVDKSGFGSCGQNPLTIFPRVYLVSNILALVIDVMVFTLTFAKTIRHTIEMRKLGLGNGLGYFILRDGAMYFLAKLLFGILGTVLFFVPASEAIGNWLSVLLAMSNPLTIILINRLVLNLRQVSHLQEEDELTLGPIDTVLEPAFAANSILGNLGAQLRVGPEDDETEQIWADDEAEVVEECRIVDHGEIIEELRDPFDV